MTAIVITLAAIALVAWYVSRTGKKVTEGALRPGAHRQPYDRATQAGRTHRG